MREEIRCLRDRHGAGVSLLRPVQTLVSPPLPPPLFTLQGAKDCGVGVVVGSRICVGRDPVVLGIIVLFQENQNLHLTQI